ncbi:MAG: YdcF family protein [Candidatus Uhrbacteria bacterium]
MNKKNAIIILAGGITKEGSLPDIPKFRADKGFELFKAGVADKIIISGRYSFLLDYTPPTTEAQIMKDYLVALGIDKEKIFLEEKSTDTIGNAYYTKQILLDKNWKNIVVVTSDFHIERTKYIFSKILGKDIFSVSYEEAPSELTTEQYEEKVILEQKILGFTMKWLDKIENGNDDQIRTFLMTDHPGYAKDPNISKQDLLGMMEKAKI